MNKFIEYNNINLNKEDNLNDIMLDLTVFDPYQHIIPYKSNKTTTKSETNTPTIKDSISEIDYKPSNLVFDPKYGFMKKFIDIANQEGLKFNITSAYRPNSKTKNGSDSWHSKGYAIDIVPLSGMSWSEFKTKLSQSPNTLRFMRENGLGIIDETTPEMLAKTGGTGAHWHIGKDKLAIDTFNRWFPQLKKGGIIKSQWGNKITGEYKVQPGDNLTKISNNLDIPVDSLLAFNNIPYKKKDDLKINQSIKWRKEPTFLDNISRFLFDSDEKIKQSNDLNKEIENNIFKWKFPIKESIKEDPIELAVKFMTGNSEKHDGWEGFIEKPRLEYGSGRGIMTVGYGLTSPEMLKKYKNGITRDQARKEMYNYIKTNILPDLTKNSWWNKLDSNMQAALIDAHYNIGGTKFRASKKLLNLLNASTLNKKLIISEMDWNKNTRNGLGDRSGARRALAAGKYKWDYIPYSNNYIQWEYTM